MKMKSLRLLPLMMLLGMNMAFAQVNFTQTTTNDFMQGTGFNVNIANDCVSLQGRMSSLEDWGATTNLPQNLISHQVTVWRDYVYLVGGYNGTTEVNTVYRATQQTTGLSSWTTLPALPVALRDMAVVASQTHLFVIGGRNAEGVSDKIYQAALNNDGSIGNWEEASVNLPQPIWGMRSVMAMGNIYIIGGGNTDDINAASKKVYRMTLDADGRMASISAMTNLPAARNGHAVAVYESQIFVIGGYDATHTAKKAVYAATINLNGTLSSWSSKTSLPTAVYDHSAVCANGIIAVIGGHDGSLPSNKCYYSYLDGTNLSWALSDIILPERYTQGAGFAFGDKLFYCGGQSISNALNSYVRFMVVNTNGQMAPKASFIGLPFNVGAPKTMQQLDYSLSYTSSTTSYEVLYRLAGANKTFGNWISAGTNLPVALNVDYSYIQYMFRFTANGSDNLSLEDVTLTLSGISQLAGNLNDVSTIALEGSPYLVTEDISFTSGSHTIEAGVVMEFMPNTGMTIGKASMNFAGTAENPILLTSNGGETGKWNGVYFQDASDNNVSSTMNYTVIEKGGNGSNSANLYLENTNQPVISHCSFNQSSTNGVRLQNSAPSISESTMDGNGLGGIYYSSTNFNATLANVTCSNNLYGVWSCSPNRSFTYDGSDVTLENNDADVAVSAGRISSDQTWNYYANGYAVLGTIEIYGSTPKLTVAAGNSIKVKSDCYIYVGYNSGSTSYGGMLYAVGTANAAITFTSYDGETGGWAGLSFRDASDYNSSSSLRYCVIEKAVNNVTCASTNQPSIMWSTIQDASNAAVLLSSSNINIEECSIKNSTYGIYSSYSRPTLVSDVIEDMSQACIWYTNAGYEPTFYSCTLKNSYLGIRYSTPNLNINNNSNVIFENNNCNYCVPGGTISDNCSWAANSYYVAGTINVGNYSSFNRLTISAGATLKFAAGANMQISYGEIYAIGTADVPITFTSMNGESGGWSGLYFDGESDYFSGQESVLKYCIIEKGNEYNLRMYSTVQPKQFEHCIIRESAGYGIYDNNSLVGMNDVHFENNAGYGVYCNSANYVGALENLIFSGNGLDGVVIGGGNITEDRTWNACTYYILGSIIIGPMDAMCRLTLSPGTVLRFAEGVRMQVSNYAQSGYYHSYYGELNAVGTADAPITFTSMNGESGGWAGLYFHNYSDGLSEMQSVLKYCIIEKGNEYNIYMDNASQPKEFEHCIIRESAGYGINVNNSFVEMNDIQFENNTGYGLYFNNAHYVDTIENLTFSGNGLDGVVIGGGTISEDRTWNAYNYYILGSIYVDKGGKDYYGPACRLTLSPGVTMKFAEGTKMQISSASGSYYHYLGELHAIGTVDAPITFTSMNGEVGGWDGLFFHDRSDHISEQESVLKYCIIENANEYNLMLDNTNQPSLIENCQLINSNGYGVSLVYASPSIKKTTIRDNASYGLYLGGSSNPTIGGNYTNGCNIYRNNGGYQVYQNGWANISMPYNFFGSIDSVYIDNALVFDQKEDNNKGRIDIKPNSWLPVNTEAFDWSGHLYYNGNTNKPLANCTIAIKDFQNVVQYQTTTNSNGYFSFNDIDLNVASKIEAPLPLDNSGINSTDALAVMRHFTQLNPLEGAQLRAADVNDSKTVNGTDALLIQRRYIGSISSFPIGNAQITGEAMVSTGNDFESDLCVLKYGDVNGSLNVSREGGVLLLNEGELLVESHQTIDLPVVVKNFDELGAVSLRFTYPEEYLEIENVMIVTESGNLAYQAEEGQLTISWYDINPLMLENGDLLLNITIMTKDLNMLEEPIVFGLEAGSELADGQGIAIDDAVIAMPSVITETLGLNGATHENAFAVAVYPNPMKDKAKIAYCLPAEGSVTLTVFNTMGNVVATLVDGQQACGFHQVELDSRQWASGVYYCRLTYGDVVKVMKMVVE